MNRTLIGAALGAALALSAAPSASAQTLNTTLGVTNAYVWRGVTLADQPSIQGDLSLGIPVAGGTFTAGAWATAEIDPDSTRFSTLTEFETGIGEVDLYAQYAATAGPATLTLGMTALRFPEISDWNTLEIFGAVALAGAPFAPSLIVRKDIDAVGGFYAEAGLSQAVPLSPSRSLTLAGVAGFSSGQTDDGDLAWYDSNGLTHVQVTASTGFGLGGFTVTPSVGFVHGVDEFAKVDGDETRYMLGLTIGRSFSLR
jgi:uncharacterized protein (TIGR02001 family)